MPKKDQINRFEKIIFSQIDGALEFIQEELIAFGCDEIDAIACKPYIIKIIKDYYDEGSNDLLREDQGVIFTIGEDDKKIPKSIAASICIYALREHFNNLISGPLKELENIQDKKTKIWARNTCGVDDIDINHRKLQVTHHFPREVAEFIGIARQVMEYDPNKLKDLLKRIPDNANGEKGFIRDLGKARLAGPEFENLLKDLQEAESEEVLDKVINHPSIANSEHAKVLTFLVDILKKKLGLSDEAKQQLEAAMAA